MDSEVDMKRGLILLLVVFVAMVCMGMGGLGGQPEGTVPDTDVNIQVQLKDRAGTSTSLSQFSMDGNTYLEAWLGRGKLTVPFKQIDSLTFGEIKGDQVSVDLRLKSGENRILAIRSRAQFYGATDFGAFRITARDVSSIDIP